MGVGKPNTSHYVGVRLLNKNINTYSLLSGLNFENINLKEMHIGNTYLFSFSSTAINNVLISIGLVM